MATLLPVAALVITLVFLARLLMLVGKIARADPSPAVRKQVLLSLGLKGIPAALAPTLLFALFTALAPLPDTGLDIAGDAALIEQERQLDREIQRGAFAGIVRLSVPIARLDEMRRPPGKGVDGQPADDIIPPGLFARYQHGLMPQTLNGFPLAPLKELADTTKVFRNFHELKEAETAARRAFDRHRGEAIRALVRDGGIAPEDAETRLEETDPQYQALRAAWQNASAATAEEVRRRDALLNPGEHIARAAARSTSEGGMVHLPVFSRPFPELDTDLATALEIEERARNKALMPGMIAAGAVALPKDVREVSYGHVHPLAPASTSDRLLLAHALFPDAADSIIGAGERARIAGWGAVWLLVAVASLVAFELLLRRRKRIGHEHTAPATASK